MFQIEKRKYCGAMESGNHLKNGAGAKRRIFSLLLSLCIWVASGLVVTSCGGGGGDNEEEEKYLTLGVSNVVFDADGMTSEGFSSYDVHVTTNMDSYEWSVYASDPWCSVEKSDYENIVSITVTPNESTSLRNSTVVVIGGELEETIAVIQEGGHDEEEEPGEDNPCDYSAYPSSAPSSLKALQNGTSIVISWSMVPDATEYHIYRNNVPTNTNSLIGTSSISEYVDNNPLSGTNYYWVKASNCVGENPSSYMASCNYNVGSGDEDKETLPSVPTGVTAKISALKNNVEISWNKVPEATGYKIYRSSSANGNYSLLNTITGQQAYGNDNAPLSGSNYYKVTAYNSAGESAKSSYAYCNAEPKKLDKPTGLEKYSGDKFVQISCNTVELAYQYELYRSKSAYGTYTKISASGGSNMENTKYTLTDSNPLSGTSYYKIKAIPLSYLNLKESDLSDYISVTR